MNLHRGFFPIAAQALASMLVLSGLALSGCKSSTQQANNPQANNPNAPSPQNSQSAPAQPGSSGEQPAPAGASAPQPPPPPATVDLPAGTRLRVRLGEDLGSRISRPGDSFSATVADDVVVNGQTVIPQGARADGTVIDAKPLGHIKGGAYLAIRLERVHTNWGSYPVATSSIDRAEKGKGKRTAIFAGGGTAFGALVGGLAGGGKGALIGAMAGGGAGTAGSAFTGNREIFLPAETLLTFHLEESVHITEQQ